MRLVLSAPAKLNLGLEVLGRRPDGYHDIVTVLQRLSLHDLLMLEPAPGLSLRVAEGECGPGGDNLALTALSELGRTLGTPINIAVTLWKRIPWGAGLGGASADAAAALRGAARLLGLPEHGPLLSQVAAQVGSDVPYMLGSGPALAEGRGERLTRVHGESGWVTLAMPSGRCGTAAVYRRVRAEDLSDGLATAAAAATPGVPAADAHRGRQPWRNGLTRPALEEAPELAELLGRLGAGWRLTGSGSCLFQQHADRAAAEAAREMAAPAAAWTAVARLTR